MSSLLYRLLAVLWRRIPVPLRWTILGLTHDRLLVGVSGVILDEQGQVLVVRHRFRGPHPWGLPGGWLKGGETPSQGWQREIQEELGCRVAVEGMVFQGASRWSLEFILVGRLLDGPLQPDPAEILEARFFPPEALPPGLQPDHRTAIRRALALRPTDDVGPRPFPDP